MPLPGCRDLAGEFQKLTACASNQGPEVPDQLLAGSRVHRMFNMQLHSVNGHQWIASSRDFAAGATQLLLIPK